MSAPRLAPDWLSVPTDPNALVDGVWPARAERADSGSLRLNGLDAERLADTFGTPVLVLDEDEVRDRARAAAEAFTAAAERHGTTARVYYAGKAFLSTAVARWVTEEGLNVDVCSPGELAVALHAGVEPTRIGYHGNNKSAAALREALDAGLTSINVDNADELRRLAAVATGPVDVVLRVLSGVHAETHDFLATAHEDQKFGLSFEDATALAAEIAAYPLLNLVGLHCHIGSQIFGVAGFRESAARVLELSIQLGGGQPLPLLNLGGGFGIAYTAADDATELPELADAIVDAVAEVAAEAGVALPALAFEPGRAISGTAGVTLYRVGSVKPVTVEATEETGTRTYVAVDGGMSDNARPALYGAQYSARLAGRSSDAAPTLVRVVGMHCESGDIVVDHEYLPGDVHDGDLLAVPVTGAYCASLSSNYNHVPRPPVVAVSHGTARVIVRGETIADLLARDAGSDEGKDEPVLTGEGTA
ncbi:diaminopimelate decarboxylase [Microbacterium gorillae]|uniref:diaminopimelate decarboxylase n=1 Tax=Microbacterium gorillae TaxID=1231063 RepID=UPI0005913692|nr:diaminopimelate decarboxylase [Microbacterium gorillae]